MNDFQKSRKEDTKCPECGSVLVFMQGGGFDYDKEYCSNWRDCNYEYEYETTTLLEEDEQEEI